MSTQAKFTSLKVFYPKEWVILVSGVSACLSVERILVNVNWSSWNHPCAGKMRRKMSARGVPPVHRRDRKSKRTDGGVELPVRRDCLSCGPWLPLRCNVMEAQLWWEELIVCACLFAVRCRKPCRRRAACISAGASCSRTRPPCRARSTTGRPTSWGTVCAASSGTLKTWRKR